MSQDLGTIYYSVDAKADGLLTTTKKVDKHIAETEKGLADVEKQMGKTNRSTAELANGFARVGKAANDAGSKAEGFSAKLSPLAGAIAGVITVQTLSAWGKMAEQFSLFQARITRLSADTETAAATYQTLLNVASKTGSSMGDTVRLWESLTSTLKSLGATNAQVLQLTSTLQKIGTIGGSSAEETSNALRQLSQGLAAGTLRAEEFNSIVENTPELARQMAKGFGMSMGELRQAMIDGRITAEALFEVLLGRTKEVDQEFAKLPRTVSQAANAITVQLGAALSVIDKMLGASQKLAAVLDGIARGIQVTFNPSDQQKFAELIQERATAEQQYQTQLKAGLAVTAANTKKRIDGLNAEIKALQDRRIAQVKSEGASSGTAAPKAAPTTTADGQKALEALAQQNQQLRAQGIERAKIIALQKLGEGATQSERDAAVALAVENYNLVQAEQDRQKAQQTRIAAGKKAETEAARQRRKDEAEAKKAADEAKRGAEQNQEVFARLGQQIAQVSQTAREAAMAQAELSLNEYATPEQIAQVRTLAGALYDMQGAKQALASADPIAAEQMNYQAQLTQLQTLNEQKLLSDQRYLELKGQAEREHHAEMAALQEANFRQASLGNELLMSSIDALAASGTQALSGLLSGTTSLKDAMGSIANTVLNSVIGAFVQMAADWVKQQVIMAAGGQAAAAAATTFGVGQAAILGTAWAGPAALASLATLGGNAAPAAAAITTTTALATTAGLTGGLKNGGFAAAGGMYRVNEGGAPEIFTGGNGQQYLLPNKRGEVVSNSDATGSGGAGQTVVNVHNYSGSSVDVQRSQLGEQDVIDIVVGNIGAGGKIGQSVNQITGTRRRGN